MEKILNAKFKSTPELSDLFKTIVQDENIEVAKFISENIPFQNRESILYYPEKGIREQDVDFSKIRFIIDLKMVNYVKDINQHFRSINKLLPDSGILIGCFESYLNRKRKIYKSVGKYLGAFIWFLDLIFNRILPKLSITGKVYKALIGNRYKVISLAETLGRSVHSGFEVITFQYISGKTLFVLMKSSEPKNDKNPSYGPFFKMKRIGKNGKIIGVYKLRTMHPYSEYLQNFVVELNGYDEAGKPKDDFRVAGWGKLFRKIWLDELPQFINVFKGELGIVGVRPLSQFRFNQLPEDVRKERIKYKPGCIPPYVALNMPDAKGNIEAERIYFEDMRKNPFTTPIRYFFKGVFNVLTRRIQSA